MVSVNTIQEGTVFAWFMLILVLRRFVLIIVLVVGGHNRPFESSRVPEDKILKRGQVAPSPVDTAPLVFTKDVRANKTITNDAENDTYFLILLLATASFSDSANGDCVRTIVYGSIYLLIRIFYAVAYILALQPWRTLLFILVQRLFRISIIMVGINTIQAGTVFAYFMLILVLRRLVLIMIIAIVGIKKPRPPNRVPEDKVFFRGAVTTTVVDTAPIVFSKDVRANRVIANDAENDAYFLILILATAVFSDSSNGDCVRTITYGSIYLFFRILYAVVYIYELQPWRTIIFFLSFCCTLACCFDLVITMSRRAN